MAYSQARRNELARERGYPNYQAEREAKARARGFASYGVERRVLRSTPKPQRPAVVELGGGQQNVLTRSDQALTAALNRAAENDLHVYARVTMIDDQGNRSEVELWSKGGWAASTAADFADAQGGAMAMIADQLAKTVYAGTGAIVDVELRAVA